MSSGYIYHISYEEKGVTLHKIGQSTRPAPRLTTHLRKHKAAHLESLYYVADGLDDIENLLIKFIHDEFYCVGPERFVCSDLDHANRVVSTAVGVASLNSKGMADSLIESESKHVRMLLEKLGRSA